MSIYISASLVRDYLDCSEKANYRLFAKPSVEIVPNKYMIMGTIVHQAIEKYWNNKDKALEYPYMQTYVEMLSIKDMNSIEHHINIYFDNFSKLMTNNDEIEKNFKTKLYDDVYLVGKFDRISNGVIYDWKTSSKVPSSLAGDVQFIIYYDAYNRIYGKSPNATFLASLSTGRLVPYEYNDFYYNNLFDVIIPKLIKDIKNRNFSKEGIFKKGMCRFCPYKQDCLKGLNNNVVMDSGEFIEE